MKTIKIVIGFILLISFLPQLAHAETSSQNYLILFNKSVDKTELNELQVKIQHEFSKIPAVKVKLTAEQAKVIEHLQNVKNVQKELTYNMSSQTTPWAFGKMNVTNQVRTQYTGKGVKVAVIDTGIDMTHPDVKAAGGTCVLDSCPHGYQDDNGHGTHVAGIIAAQNNSIGTVGVAPNVQLYAVKALNVVGSGTTTNIADGIEWAIEQHVDIMNLSFTTKDDDPTLRAMIKKAHDAGIVIVGAAGNAGTTNGSGDTVLYPAKYDSVIGVAALDQNSNRIVESSTGSEVEVAAPGYNIVSTVPKDVDTFDGAQDGYMPMTGTSMAAPYVTGLLALYKEKFPSYTSAQLRNVLDANAKDIGAAGKDPLYGFGIAGYGENPISELPSSVRIDANENGEAAFAFDKNSSTKSVDIYRNGTVLAQNILDDTWKDYIEKGTYQYQFVFHQTDGTVTKQSLSVAMGSPAFDDLAADAWYAPHMIYLYHNQILNGEGPNTLLPSKQITRGEAVALLGRAIGLNGEKRAIAFSDVGSQYFASGYIQSAKEKGILNGFEDGTFKPNQNVTRAEMAILLARAYHLQDSAAVDYSDVNGNVTGETAIYELANAKITEGYPDGSFKPHEYMTRAKFSVFLARAEDKEFIGR
ncbi:S8 family peptidase [Falsibacillus albus]|uniref:Alkaline serine protease n=1 Tax=Falsibacillus albus TaxID=2478915 RepID=A0A3L7K1B0_9BACI|nr:S8 family serine peptidase [Falsibacillus albus]RLQ96836.1 alkaline serine protease [Falsibacillus albus]